MTLTDYWIPEVLWTDATIKSVQNTSYKDRELGKKYYSNQITKGLHKLHYTTEAMLELVITYIKLSEDVFTVTIYRPFYQTVWT